MIKNIYILTGLFFSLNLEAAIIFEGYYRIEDSGKHVGFSVLREDFDPIKKIRTIQYLVNTRDRDQKIQKIEATTRQTENYQPLSSDFKGLDGDAPSRLQISVAALNFQLQFRGEDIKSAQAGKFSKNEFWSSAAHRVLAANKFAVGKTYKYRALREDLGVHRVGQIQVLAHRSEKGFSIFQIYDDFENNAEEAWISIDGEILKSRIPTRNVTSTLVSTSQEALGSLGFEKSDLAIFFGDVPEGQINSIAAQKVKLKSDWFPAKIDTKPKVISGAIALRLPSAKELKKAKVSK
jgi:hypothetical protein